jgi:uncharacterized GH25 family protein
VPEEEWPPPAANPPVGQRVPFTESDDGGSIEGKVCDGTGKPLHNATVTAFLNRQPERYAFSGSDGTYVVKGLAAGQYEVRADREGYAVALKTGIKVIEMETTPNVDFVLSRGGAFSGIVVDREGSPIPAANVTLYATGPVDTAGGQVRSFREKTSEKGRFLIENVTPGAYRALAQHEIYLPSDRIPFDIAEDETVTHEFVLEMGASISGTVTDLEGNPVVEAQIWLSSTEEKIVFSRGARTDSEGKYVLGGLQSGSANIRVIAPGFVTATRKDIELRQGRPVEGVDFKLDSGRSISGTVTNSSGEPVGGATVSGSDSVSYKTAKTDEDGKFTMSGFSEDKINLSVRAKGYVLLIRRGISANTEDAQLVLSTGGAVEGQAISDESMKSFVVVLYSIPEGGKQRRIVKQKICNDPDGFFKVEDIPQGTYTLEVHSKDYIQYSPEMVAVSENSTVSGLRIPMRRRQ